MATYRNTLLKGFISKEKAEQLLGGERAIVVTYRGTCMHISRNDFEDIVIDLYDIANEEPMCGEFDRI